MKTVVSGNFFNYVKISLCAFTRLRVAVSIGSGIDIVGGGGGESHFRRLNNLYPPIFDLVDADFGHDLFREVPLGSRQAPVQLQCEVNVELGFQRIDVRY